METQPTTVSVIADLFGLDDAGEETLSGISRVFDDVFGFDTQSDVGGVPVGSYGSQDFSTTLPTLDLPVINEASGSGSTALVIDLSILFLTMQSLQESGLLAIEHKSNERDAAFEEFYAALEEQAEKAKEKCGGAGPWMKVLQIGMIVVSAAAIVASAGTMTGPALAIAVIALGLETADLIVEAATGEGVFARAGKALAPLMEAMGVPEEYSELVATILVSVVIMLVSLPMVANGVAKLPGRTANFAKNLFKNTDAAAEVALKTGTKAASKSTKVVSSIDDVYDAKKLSTILNNNPDWSDDLAQHIADNSNLSLSRAKTAVKRLEDTEGLEFLKKVGSDEVTLAADGVGTAVKNGAKVGAEGSSTMLTKSGKLTQEAIERVEAGMREILNLMHAGKNPTLLSTIRNLVPDPAAVKQISRFASTVDIAASLGQSSIQIQQGKRTIELAAIDRDVKELKTDLDIIAKELEIDFELFTYYMETGGNIPKLLNELDAQRGETLRTIQG